MHAARPILALHFTPGLGPVKIKTLLEHFGTAENALSAKLTDLRDVPGLETKTIAGIGAQAHLERAEVELERANRLGMTLLTLEDDAYPEALRAIYDPPPVLWVRGDPAPLHALRGPVPRSIGIVGTRQCSSFARTFTATLAHDLARSDVTVISGLARGIDTEAHRASLEAGGPSIGVLGCGADRIYPPENASLAARMTVVSGYAIGTPPAGHNFPARNRIIAGLSSGAVVVEGDVTSGAMITAVAALEAGRSVFAVPGRPGDANAKGPNRLIRDGAVLIESAADVLEELRWGTITQAPLETPTLEGAEAHVFSALERSTDGTLLDQVVAKSGLSAPEAQAALMMLSLRGLVRELPGGRYSRA